MTVIGPALPSERVPLSTGGSRLAKVLFVGASAFCVLRALIAQARAAEAHPGSGAS